MPTFGQGSYLDIVLLVSLLCFMAVARKIRIPDMISLGIVLGIIGVLCIVVRFATFRHITCFEGADAARLGIVWLCLSASALIAGFRSIRRNRIKERQNSQQENA